MKINPSLRKGIWFFVLLIVLAAALLAGRAGAASAAALSGSAGGTTFRLVSTTDQRPQDDQTGQQVRVGVYLISVRELDLTKGTYIMDFYLNFECDEPCDPSGFQIMNGQILETDAAPGYDTYHNYHVIANLYSNFILWDYPFDRHWLNLILEDRSLDTSQLVYVADPDLSGVDAYVSLAGWQIPPFFDSYVYTHEYPMFTDYSDYNFSLPIVRPALASFWKGIFASIVIGIVGPLSLLMQPEQISERLALSTSALVGAILYHLTLTSGIPSTGYLTYADKFMLVLYLVLGATLAVTVSQMMLIQAKKETFVHKLHAISRWLVPAAWVVLIIFITVSTYWVYWFPG
jgi:hypothetical protein